MRIIAILICCMMARVAWADDWKTLKINEASTDCPPDDGKIYEITGDFDGNGKVDVARFQADKKTKRRRVAVWLNGNNKPEILADDKLDMAGSFMTLVKTGSKLTSVEDGKTAINLKTPGIGYGTCESSEQVFYWDGKAKVFKSIWISD